MYKHVYFNILSVFSTLTINAVELLINGGGYIFVKGWGMLLNNSKQFRLSLLTSSALFENLKQKPMRRKGNVAE